MFNDGVGGSAGSFAPPNTYVTARAPWLMVTVGPFIIMVAPCPFEIRMPVSLIEIIAPAVVFKRIPPAAPGASLRRNELFKVVCIAICAMVGGLNRPVAGASPGPQ